ncbi:MAG: flippase [Candidatus Binataceae bacterium]
MLVGNSLWNLAGDGLPMLVAVFCLPAIIHGMGKQRFGILAISWMVVGYLSLLDLGLGRALTKYLSEKIALQRREEISGLFWTAFLLMSIIGLVGMCALLCGNRLIVYRGFNVPVALRHETRLAFFAIALSLPALISAAALRGLLAAFQRFDLINAVRIPISVFSFVAPLLVLQFSHSLAVIVGVLVAGRVVAWLVQFFLCLQVVEALWSRPFLDYRYLLPMLSFGGWITSLSVIAPMLVYSDRFLIGTILSMSAVTYYSTPFEVVYKVQILPAAIAQVMFPAFSYSLTKNPQQVASLFERANKYALGLIFPFALLTAALAPQMLRLWLGPEFQRHSTVVTQCFAAGLLLSGVTYMPAALIQAAGRPDLYAKLVLFETPIYLPLVWFAVRRFGIDGAAIATVLRCLANVIFCFLFTIKVAPGTALAVRRNASWMAGALCALALGATLPGGIATRAIFAVMMLTISALAAWKLVLDQEERGFLLGGLSAIWSWI